VPQEIEIENHEFRYFKFVNEDPSVEKVTFTVNAHHGDPDLYVSRFDKYPTKEYKEKVSSRSGRFADTLSFSRDEDGSIQRIFYIGVTGFTYSTFSISATTVRGIQKGETKATIIAT
jgi:hypothetical protein